MKNNTLKKMFFIMPVILALAFVIIAGKSIGYKSNTRDESKHMVRGIMLLETGDFRLNKHHPPLANFLATTPQLWNDDLVVPSTDSSLWENAQKDALASELVAVNGGKRDFVFNILNRSRYVVIGSMAVLGAIMSFIVYKEYGFLVSIIFSVLYFFSPNIIAHSRLVTTDALIVPLGFLSTFALYKYLQDLTTKRLIIFIIFSFIALMTKYSIVPIAALWILLLYIFMYRKIRVHESSKLKTFFKAMKIPFVVISAWLILMTACFGFRFNTLASTNHADTAKTEAHLGNIADITQSVPFLTKPAQWLYTDAKLPFPEYIQGFFENVLLHDRYGHDSFLYGMYAKKGWWYYFPAALAVKMPVPALIGIAAIFLLTGTAICKYFKLPPSKKKDIRKKHFYLKAQYIFAIVPIFYFLLSMKSSINLGVRHIILVFPFIYLGIALIAKDLIAKYKWSKIAVGILGIWYVVSCISVFPHYLEYFNELVGGPKNGYKYLLDSNLSWAQDDFYVEDWINNYDGDLPVYRNLSTEIERGIVVIDVDRLMGRSEGDRDRNTWIREQFLSGELKPIERINYTYMVFEIQPEN